MLIHERSVTREYASRIFKIVRRHVRGGRFEIVNHNVVRVGTSKHRRSYAILCNDLPIAWLYLWRRPGWIAWEVIQIFVLSSYRSSGYAKALYRAAIHDDNIMIASGTSHTRSSRALWESFVRDELFDVYAIDFKNLESRAQVYIEDNELQCSLPLYEEVGYETMDVRLVATRKL